jgi:hypothetical protein
MRQYISFANFSISFFILLHVFFSGIQELNDLRVVIGMFQATYEDATMSTKPTTEPIDPLTETLISQEETGLSPPTFYRYTTHGFRGVLLASLNLGGARVTSREALARFIRALSTPEQCERLRERYRRMAEASVKARKVKKAKEGAAKKATAAKARVAMAKIAK